MVQGARITGNKDGVVFLQAGEEKVLKFAVVNLSNVIFRRFVRRFVPFLTGMEAGNYGLTNGRTDFIKLDEAEWWGT